MYKGGFIGMEYSVDYSKMNLKEFLDLYKVASPEQKEEMDHFTDEIWPKESREKLAAAMIDLKEKITGVKNNLEASGIFDALTKALRETGDNKGIYSGLAIKKYCRIREISEKRLCNMLDIDKSTLYKYEKGIIDVPATKLIQISEILNVSTDLLLKRKKRELKLGYLGNNVPLFEYNYKKQEIITSNVSYALDQNLKNFKERIQVIKYEKPIHELGLPRNSILFIVDKKQIDLDAELPSDFGAFIEEKDKTGKVTEQYFSYIQKIVGKDKDYSSAVNYNFEKDGRTYTCGVGKLKEMLSKIILKAVVDF